jgi:hypothetical protein
MKNTYKIFVGKFEGKRPFGRPKNRPRDDIKMGLKEAGCENMDSTFQTQNRN